MDKDTRKVLDAAEKQGFTVTIKSNGHAEVRKNGAFVAVAAGTTSDHRSLKNLIAALRRHGFVWPPRR